MKAVTLKYTVQTVNEWRAGYSESCKSGSGASVRKPTAAMRQGAGYLKERNRGLAKKRRLLSEGEKRITELDMIFKRLYEDNISGKLTDERFHKLSTDYEAEQTGLQTQAAILREEIEEVEGKSANVDRFLSVVRQYTDIPELTPRILHEFVEKIVIHAATDPHSKINRRQEVDIYYKGIGILEISKVFDSRQK